MPDYVRLKAETLQELHDQLEPVTVRIAGSAFSHQAKAKQVNAEIGQVVGTLRERALDIADSAEKQGTLLVIQYCASVVSLEYRHRVWPYEYMAFSRRVGELWERFCSACWDSPSRPYVNRIEAPSFENIALNIGRRIAANARGADNPDDIESDVNVLLSLIGGINMKEDEVFQVSRTPHVIDFKSGFGSNEKGNTLRLLAVGRAYLLWNSSTKLFLLVRQVQNNNYLDVIRRSDLWSVHCGADAYAKIDELSGANTQELRRSVIDFEADLSPQFLGDIDAQLANLRGYLDW